MSNKELILSLLVLLVVGSIECSRSYNKYNHDDIDSNFWTGPDPEINEKVSENVADSSLSAITKTPFPETNTKNTNTLYETRTEIQNNSNKENEQQIAKDFPWKSLFIGVIVIALFYQIISSNTQETEEHIPPHSVEPEPIENIIPSDHPHPESEIQAPKRTHETKQENPETDPNTRIQEPPIEPPIELTSSQEITVPSENSEQRNKIILSQTIIAANSDRGFQILIEKYQKREREQGLTVNEYYKLQKIQLMYERQVLNREFFEHKKKQTDALEQMARNGTEALVFKRTRIVFDYFEQWESFLRYWSLCTLFAIWGLTKLRGFAPSATKFTMFDNIIPWWVPRNFLPNGSFVVPCAIIVSLVCVVFIIFATQGNSIASILIFSMAGLLVLWSLDSTTIASGAFCLLRLLFFAVLFCVVCTAMFTITYLFKNRSLLSRIWVYIFAILSLGGASYLGFWIAVTDYPNLPTSYEFVALDYIDKIIESMSK